MQICAHIVLTSPLIHPCSCLFSPPKGNNRSSINSAATGECSRPRSPRSSPPRRIRSAVIFAISRAAAFAAVSTAARYRSRRLRARLRSPPPGLSIAGRAALHPEDAEIKRALLRNSSRVAAGILNEKLETSAPFALGPAESLDRVVLEADAPEPIARAFADRGMTVLRAKPVEVS